MGNRALALTEREVGDEQLAQELMLERYELDMRELAWSVKAARFAESDYYDQAGSVSPIDWLRHNCHMTEGAAAARVAVGRRMSELPESLQALAAGKIGFAHLTVMTRTADAVSDAFQEPKLLNEAEQSSPGKFFHTCRHYRHSADPVGYAAEQTEQVENRSLRLSRAEDGWYLLSGVLDSIGGAAVRNALEPLARKSGEHDDRNRERRLADALVEFVERAQPAHLQVTTSLETLLGLCGAPGAEMEFSLPISAKTVERLACDSSVMRILLGSESQVIDVGRSKRVVTGPGRKALEARDGHCRWPGCDRPARWSAAHHVVHWIHGGGTDLDNLILLCHRHHWMVHEGGWQLVKTDGGPMMAIAPTVTFGHMARGPD
jgi:hypothetical protein